jgi:hypothetical protein
MSFLQFFWLVLVFHVIIPLSNQILLFYFCNLFYYSLNVYIYIYIFINCICLIC